MPRKKAADPKLEQLAAENARLREMVELQSAAAQTHQARLASALPTHRVAGGELMVGIRNICDSTVGIPPQFPGDIPVTLHADLDPNDPRRVAVISYTLWRSIRGGSLVGQGLIMRDDTVLGDTFNIAPEDRPGEVHDDFTKNAVVDPKEWIHSRTEDEIRRDIDLMTSDESLRRIRRVIDDELRAIQATYPDKGTVESAKRALRQLPAKYAWLDEHITMKLERTDEQETNKPLTM